MKNIYVLAVAALVGISTASMACDYHNQKTGADASKSKSEKTASVETTKVEADKVPAEPLTVTEVDQTDKETKSN